MPSITTRQKNPTASTAQQVFLRSVANRAESFKALDMPDSNMLFKTLTKGTSINSVAKLARILGDLATTFSRAASSLQAPASQRLMQAAQERGRAVRVDLVASKKVLPSREITNALGISRQALSKAVHSNRLFALTVDGENYYPSFYLDNKLDLRQLEQVSKKLGKLSGWEKWRFFTTPKGSLAKLTPLDALKKGKLDDVITAATGFAER